MPDNTYTIALIPAPEGGYTVICLELPGVVSQGETVEEAREMITDAIQLMLQSHRDHRRKDLESGAWEERIQVPHA